MLNTDGFNSVFNLAADLVNNTSQHIFLTGKAGTGKTTFLKYIKENSTKNTVVVAPTGVAAINAGGVTMHSFFQLPRGLFIPGSISRDRVNGFTEINDRHSLFKNIHFAGNKRDLLQEMELLVIDEVSMVRCDMLDAVDIILRHFRRTPNLPFGGVQVLYIGDLFQLPPVVSNEEWGLMQEYYESPFFFSSKVLAEIPPVYIELKKIYRQTDQDFISVLNRIRNNEPLREDFDFLNRKYDPGFEGSPDDHYITITTHNKKADAINAAELAKLPGRSWSFKALIKNEFSDKAFPTDMELQLKVGAQVMFIKNDSSPEKRYFNGKIATIKYIQSEEISVSFDDGSDNLVLEKETWKNIRYTYDKEMDEINEEELGSFTQYPVRLAWAITIHKSQGLTFEKAIIDAGSSFAAGQVYVALSRCTSMDGLILKSKIHSGAISTDKRIIEFSRREIEDPGQLEQLLEKEKFQHASQQLIKLFDWNKLIAALYSWIKIIPGKKLPDTNETLQLAQSLLTKAKEQSETAQKFQRQLNSILMEVRQTGNTILLQERMAKGIGFFATDISKNILLPLQQHISFIWYASKLTKYKQDVQSLEQIIWQHMHKLLSAKWESTSFADPGAFKQFTPATPKKTKSSAKEPKILSRHTSFELFRSGKSIEEIARLRNITPGTVEGHLSYYVTTGEISASELVPMDKIQPILKVIETIGSESTGLIKSKLGEEFSFFEIRIALNHYFFSRKKQLV